jgi:signal transduction histidine kinase
MQVQDAGPITSGGGPRHSLTGAEFRRRFRWLVFHSWNIPPVFGLGFILLIGVLTPAQLLGILITPLEPAYIIVWLAFALWFLPRSMRPLSDWLDGKPGSSPDQAARAVQRFPLLYWTTFIVYLVMAPVSVVAAAHIYTDFVATPLALFRIELVALIVSIIVGLPIFFLIFDLFGQALGGLELKRPIITIKTKVFLIGALVPLLIDTMLVQYYWTRTGFFTFETFGVWLLLEALAIGGSLIFAHSFGQSLGPLQKLIGVPHTLPEASISALRPLSTDELGLLTTEYRLLLDELRLYNEHLEDLIKLRTAELETTNRELEAFSYSVSHDLRAPLRAIDGFARALSEDYADRLDESGLDYLRRVCGGAQRMGYLIDDMLQLSRISRATLNPASVNLSAMARAITAQLAANTPEREATVEITPGLTGHGDERLLNIVLTNLLDNAWKYSGKTEAARIEFGAVRQDNEIVYFVRDNGAGFDMQYAGKLFGAFQRLHGAEFPGTGIGLATVQRIVRRHGGRVWAEAEPAKGAAFFFTLDMREPPLEAETAEG